MRNWQHRTQGLKGFDVIKNIKSVSFIQQRSISFYDLAWMYDDVYSFSVVILFLFVVSPLLALVFMHDVDNKEIERFYAICINYWIYKYLDICRGKVHSVKIVNFWDLFDIDKTCQVFILKFVRPYKKNDEDIYLLHGMKKFFMLFFQQY